MAPYQNFRYESSLIKNLYTTEIIRRDEDMKPEDDKEELEANILNRQKQRVTFLDYLFIKYLLLVHCCLSEKRKSAYKMHQIAQDRLNREIEVVSFI